MPSVSQGTAQRCRSLHIGTPGVRCVAHVCYISSFDSELAAEYGHYVTFLLVPVMHGTAPMAVDSNHHVAGKDMCVGCFRLSVFEAE
jgi:hypothetical protein